MCLVLFFWTERETHQPPNKLECIRQRQDKMEFNHTDSFVHLEINQRGNIIILIVSAIKVNGHDRQSKKLTFSIIISLGVVYRLSSTYGCVLDIGVLIEKCPFAEKMIFLFSRRSEEDRRHASKRESKERQIPI